MKLKVINGNKNESIEVSPGIFDLELNPALVALAVKRQLANRRKNIAHTKTRGEVSGGGRKPFRQKGTGRARAGSSRSPIWIGGGIVFGPRKNRQFHENLNKKLISKAILGVLSTKNKDNKLIIVKEFKFEKIATKTVQSFLEKLPIEEGKILIILSKTNPELELSLANVPYTKVLRIENLNIIDLLKYDYLLTDNATISKIEEKYTSKK